MPISAIDNCSEQHWIEVKEILEDIIDKAGFEPNLVSNTNEVGIIQATIIQNVYENPIVVCDVSGKNPNVMFELGMRLAFDKPTIIVKDDITSYNFDTSPIEHLKYPRDLNYNKINSFKNELKEKIQATFYKSKEDSNFSTFLKHFGKFTVAKLDTKEVSKEEFIIKVLDEFRSAFQRFLESNLNLPNKFNIEDNTHSLCKGQFLLAIKDLTDKFQKAYLLNLPFDSLIHAFNDSLHVIGSNSVPYCYKPDKKICRIVFQEIFDKFNSFQIEKKENKFKETNLEEPVCCNENKNEIKNSKKHQKEKINI